MQDSLNARLMGSEPTGNGRRESYEHIPMPRMTNTYMLSGTDAPEDIIRSVKRGVFAANFGGVYGKGVQAGFVAGPELGADREVLRHDER